MKKKLLALLLGSSSHVLSDHYSSYALEDSFIHLPQKNRIELSSPFLTDFDDNQSTKEQILNPSSSPKIISHLPVISLENLDNDGNASPMRVNTTFIKNVGTYSRMIDLSYHLVKGRNELTTSIMEDFLAKGWNINAFGGFSGSLRKKNTDKYVANNHDLSGFVAFNKSTGEAVVTFHGSQDGFDWQNNLDGQKVIAQENGLEFEGSVHKGINYRYQSSKQSIYAILDKYYNELDNKDLFHITTTGHSLGGGMATLAYADLATDYIKARLGEEYNNNTHNRVRSFAASPPRIFDSVAVEDLNYSIGETNIIIDAVNGDPVITSGPGKTVTKWLEGSSKYGITARILSVAKIFNIIPYSNPQAVAFTHGDYMHLGQKALQDAAKVKATAKMLDQRDTENQLLNGTTQPKSFIKRIKNLVAGKFAHIHYGRQTSVGLGFEKEFIIGETLEERINEYRKDNRSVPTPASTPSTSWWSKIRNLVAYK